MKNLVFVIFFIIIAYFPATAQNMQWDWAVNDLGDRAVVADAAGNIYTAYTDLTKYAPDGRMIWTKPLTTQSQVILASSLAIDDAGYLYMAGSFRSGQNARLGQFLLNGYGRFDIFTAKLDTAGQVLWARQCGSPLPPNPSPAFVPDEEATGVAVDANGNCYISGKYFIGPYFKFENTNYPIQSTYNAFIAKYDSAGVFQWVQPSPMYTLGGISADSDGNSYIAGSDTIGIVTARYSTAGNQLWLKHPSKGESSDFATGIYTDTLYNTYITGRISDTTTFGSFTLTGAGQAFLVKYDSTGTVLWAVESSGGGAYGEAVYADKQGGVYMAGGISGNTSSNGHTVQHFGNMANIFAAKFDAATGSALWAKGAGGYLLDYAKAVTALPNGDCFITGYYNGSSTFGSHTLSGSSSFLAKITAAPTAVAAPLSEELLRLYPNPSQSEFNISLPASPTQISISNLKGQQVFSTFTQNASETLISVADWPAGVYVVKVLHEGKVHVQKLVVVK